MRTDAGLLLIDKPAGATSHDAVLRVRRALGTRKVGHTGTLDPFATGLLLSLVGPLTRLAELYHALPKSYDATMRLGRETDTGDLTGRVVSESPLWRDRSPDEIRSAISAREGEGLQVPSAFSARQVGGRRAYEMARRGERPELEARAVTVHEIRVGDMDLPRVRFRARVSTGTYIRALARDVGRDLGCGAHLTELRRTAIGPFLVDDALDPGELAPESLDESAAWRTGVDALPWLPRRRLDDEERAQIRHGRPVALGDLSPPRWVAPEPAPSGGGPDARVDPPIVLFEGGSLVAIAERRDGRLFPKKVFAA